MKKEINIFKYLYFICGFFFLYSIRIEAYIDPSVMTYAIQAIAGMAIALGTFIGIYWRRIKRYLEQKYQLDFHTNQVNESDNLYYKDTKDEIHFSSKDKVSKSSQASIKQVGYQPALLLSFALSFLWMFFAPLNLYFTSIHEFKYDLYAILPTILLMFVVGLVVGIVLFFIAKKINNRLYRIGLLLALILLIASFIQGNFLLSDLPSLDGSAFDWGNHPAGLYTSIIVWSVVIVVLIYLFRKWNQNVFIFFSNVSSIIIIGICTLTLVINGLTSGGFLMKRSAVVTKEDEFTYSTNKNFIILVVDAADGESYQKLFDDHNEYKELLKDFSFYPDTVGAYPFTKYAIPFILTGIWNENQEDFISFETKAMDESPLFQLLETNHYHMGMYEADITYDSDHIYRFNNIHEDRYQINNVLEFARTNGRVIWFLYAPYPFKQYFTNPGMISVLQNRAKGQGESFSSLNHDFYQDVLNKSFTTKEENSFKFIHIDGAHVPFQYDEDVNLIPMSEGSYSLNMKASMTIIDKYLEKLKETNVYDQSILIILGDHGYVDNDEEDGILGRENPLLLIKGIYESHDSLNVSNLPISYDDLQEAYKRLLNNQLSDEIFDVKENDKRKRRYLSYDYTDEKNLYEYFQEGYASDETTLIPTGKVFRP